MDDQNAYCGSIWARISVARSLRSSAQLRTRGICAAKVAFFGRPTSAISAPSAVTSKPEVGRVTGGVARHDALALQDQRIHHDRVGEGVGHGAEERPARAARAPGSTRAAGTPCAAGPAGTPCPARSAQLCHPGRSPRSGHRPCGNPAAARHRAQSRPVSRSAFGIRAR